MAAAGIPLQPPIQHTRRGTCCQQLEEGGIGARPGGGRTVRSFAESRGFRGFAWGASKAEVKKGEKLPLHHDLEDEIAFWNFELAGVEAGG